MIAAWHVVEHLADPWPTLEAAVSRLTDSGIFVLAMPNPGAFQFKALGRNWPHVDAPRHLRLIPIDVLDKRLRDLGLSPELVTTRDDGGNYWNYFGWQWAMLHFLPQRL